MLQGDHIQVHVVRLPHAEGLPLPSYMTPGAAALDLSAAVSGSIVIEPGAVALVPTGFAIALPPGHEGQVRPRSGLATESSITLVNAPGTIDADYRGEVFVALINLGQDPFEVTRGMRIAQLVVAPVSKVTWNEVSALPPSPRGERGFGHTGH